MQLVRIATGSPQSNGHVERLNKSLGPMIPKLVDPEKGIYWDFVVETIKHTHNNTLHRAIGENPSKMLFGIQQRGKTVDSLKECLVEVEREKRDN